MEILGIKHDCKKFLPTATMQSAGWIVKCDCGRVHECVGQYSSTTQYGRHGTYLISDTSVDASWWKLYDSGAHVDHMSENKYVGFHGGS